MFPLHYVDLHLRVLFSQSWTTSSVPLLSFWVFYFTTFYLNFVNNCPGYCSVNHWSNKLITHCSNPRVTNEARNSALSVFGTLFVWFRSHQSLVDWKMLRLGGFSREEYPSSVYIFGRPVVFSPECDSEIWTSVSGERERSDRMTLLDLGQQCWFWRCVRWRCFESVIAIVRAISSTFFWPVSWLMSWPLIARKHFCWIISFSPHSQKK